MTAVNDDLDRRLRALAPAYASSARASAAAVAGLGAAAAAAGLLDIAVGTVSSPIGDLLVAVTPKGLLRVGFADEPREQVLAELARKVSPRILESAAATDEIRRELDEYFAGRRIRFDVRVDRRLIHGIARDVLAATRRVPFGGTTTYGELAASIGEPKAARAVGNALGSNPIPIVIPCHRVLRAGGALGGYAGGLARKERLLELEGVALGRSPR